jgi:septal ring factor EnvC (AmiA/AmiB activator)
MTLSRLIRAVVSIGIVVVVFTGCGAGPDEEIQRLREEKTALVGELTTALATLSAERSTHEARVNALEADLASAGNWAATVTDQLAAARDELQGCLNDLTRARS